MRAGELPGEDKLREKRERARGEAVGGAEVVVSPGMEEARREYNRQALPRLRPIVGEVQPGENARAIIACNDYLRMGRIRSVARVKKLYQDMSREARARGQRVAVPTTDNNKIYDWSKRFSWRARAEAYDAMMEAKRTAAAEAEMTTGLAQAHERVSLLKELTDGIVQEIADKGFYAEKTHVAGQGENRRETSEEVFRSHEVAAVRGLLNDLAKETGGRIHRAHVTHGGLAGILASAQTLRRPTAPARAAWTTQYGKTWTIRQRRTRRQSNFVAFQGVGFWGAHRSMSLGAQAIPGGEERGSADEAAPRLI